MTDSPDFEVTRNLMVSLGFIELNSRFSPEAFGSWFITAEANGKRFRIIWDGRDDALVIQRQSLSGRHDDWVDRWIAGESYARKVGDLREGLISVMKLEQ
jgi:hypothetical protein